MGKDKKSKNKSDTKSETLQTTATESEVIGISEPMKVPETEKPQEEPIPEPLKPKPKFTGPLIAFRNINVKAGGVVSVHCLDNKVPLPQIQIIQIKAGDAIYVYRRI